MNENENQTNGTDLSARAPSDASAPVDELSAKREEASAAAQQGPAVLRWQLFEVEGEWPPEDGLSKFSANMPLPAIYQKGFAVKSGLAGLDGRPALKCKLIFIVCPDAPVVARNFVFQPQKFALQIARGGEQPELADVLINPLTGMLVGLWQLPIAELIVPEGKTSNDLEPVAGEISEVEEPPSGG